ncbi:ABC transporter permease [Nocardia miyunensis]|uniref:ABC transporter permease n=1 Tax=Nocardia miyunensis TaxID=282684 RepID=UPI001471051A|nr:ABC transporter permease subunit [Nocardia miyunensis]
MRVPLIVLGGLLAAFLLLPSVLLLATSWTGGQFLTFPPRGFSPQWYLALLSDSTWTGAFWLSVGVAGAATVIATVLGTAAALAVARMRTGGRLLRTLFVAPVAVPVIAYALGLHNLVQRVPVLADSLIPLILGEAVLAFPLVFVVVNASVARLDPALRPAAATMGARWPTIVRRVELPLLTGAIAAGALFAFNAAFDEVVLSVYLVPVGQYTLPLQMLDASREAISPQLTAASTVVSVLALVILGGAGLLRRRAT